MRNQAAILHDMNFLIDQIIEMKEHQQEGALHSSMAGEASRSAERGERVLNSKIRAAHDELLRLAGDLV